MIGISNKTYIGIQPQSVRQRRYRWLVCKGVLIETCNRTINFQQSNSFRCVQDLSMEIGQLNNVAINKTNRSYARTCKILCGRTPEPAYTND